jgi:hypothetical protein
MQSVCVLHFISYLFFQLLTLLCYLHTDPTPSSILSTTREHERDRPTTTALLPNFLGQVVERGFSVSEARKTLSFIDNERWDACTSRFGQPLAFRRRQWERRKKESATQHSDKDATPQLHATNNLSQGQRIAMLPRKATKNATARGGAIFIFSSATIVSCLFYCNKLKHPSSSALARSRRPLPKQPGPRHVTRRFPNVHGTPGRLRVFIGHADEPQVICLFSCDVAVNSDCVTLQRLGAIVESDSFLFFNFPILHLVLGFRLCYHSSGIYCLRVVQLGLSQSNANVFAHHISHPHHQFKLPFILSPVPIAFGSQFFHLYISYLELFRCGVATSNLKPRLKYHALTSRRVSRTSLEELSSSAR